MDLPVFAIELGAILEIATSTLLQFIGKHAAVSQLNLPADEVTRLKSLGLFEGQEIAIQRTGSAVIVRAAGGRVAISDEIAKNILVQPLVEQVS